MPDGRRGLEVRFGHHFASFYWSSKIQLFKQMCEHFFRSLAALEGSAATFFIALQESR